MKRLHILAAALALSLFAAPHAKADTFDYTFTALASPYADFSVTVVEPALITTTGWNSLSTPLPTSLGYQVENFGGNDEGNFLFSNTGGIIDDVLSDSAQPALLFSQAIHPHPI